jgi:hypothetical protein
MLMLIDTPDPRYGGDRGGDGPGPPHVGVRTVALLGGCAICLYLARFTFGVVQFALLAGAFSALLAAIFSLWRPRDGPPAEEP